MRLTAPSLVDTFDGVGHELGHQQLVLFHGDAPWELGVNPR